ncbi:MAG: hypothetical protein CVU69_09595 [Deltaproteobacteria bacterium HGW-Deltaproteobacteria-4]|nr:MAG: hypothetical protein CVU69_09595 [Deltaproteobacteria bacterium HGW-Deltaproteobacteria-4]
MLLPPASQPSSVLPAVPAIVPPPFVEEILTNGLHLRYYDQTNRYFGDYHRVRIVVEIELALSNELLIDQELLTAGKKRFGVSLTTNKVLERMGVPGGRVDALRAELVASYQNEVQNYLSRPEVPLRLLRAELAIKPSASTILRMR